MLEAGPFAWASVGPFPGQFMCLAWARDRPLSGPYTGPLSGPMIAHLWAFDLSCFWDFDWAIYLSHAGVSMDLSLGPQMGLG